MTSDLADARRSAWRFFWCWLILASTFSVAANVAHAVLLAPAETVWLTGAAAVIPPCVQIAATHSISLLVRSRAGGWTCRSALAMTVVIGVFAFILSFDTIRSLALTLGFTGDVLGVPIAAIFPLAIDVSIAHATLCLLAQTAPPRAHAGTPSIEPANAFPRRRPWIVERDDAGAEGQPPSGGPAPTGPAPGRPLGAVPCTPGCSDRDDPAGPDAADPGSTELLTLAQTLVRNRVTTKEPELVYDVLADRAAGMRPTAIATKHNVHHSVVRKLLRAAELDAS